MDSLLKKKKKKPSKANKFLSVLLKAQIYLAYTKQQHLKDDW